MEAIQAQRQRPPINAEACDIINRGLRVTVELMEEEVDEEDVVETPRGIVEDDAEMDAATQDVQELPNRQVLEVDEEERSRSSRGPAHLTNYRSW